jgi:hypothetical protein
MDNELHESIEEFKKIIQILQERKKENIEEFNLELNNLEIAILLFELYVKYRKRPMEKPLAAFFYNGRLLFDANYYDEYFDEILDYYNFMFTYLIQCGYLEDLRGQFLNELN